MNIFFLDRDPAACAEYHCDKHVSKMIVEYAQLMSTAHHEHGSTLAPQCYQRTHVNHPSAVWARDSADHYSWLFKLFVHLNGVYTQRYHRIHLTFDKLVGVIKNAPALIPDAGWCDPPQCMPDEFKAADTVTAYRNYYCGGKSFARWQHSPAPDWFKLEV